MENIELESWEKAYYGVGALSDKKLDELHIANLAFRHGDYSIMDEDGPQARIPTKVIVYTMDDCVWCVKAKSLLNLLAIEYEERDVLDSNVAFKTVPHIIINEKQIGGYTDFIAYIRSFLLGEVKLCSCP